MPHGIAIKLKCLLMFIDVLREQLDGGTLASAPSAGAREPQGQEEHDGPDCCVDDEAYKPRREMHSKSMQEPVADERADDADCSVADETKSVAPHNFAGQPSDNQADHQNDDQRLIRHPHRLPALPLLIRSVAQSQN